jgi:hypothetical protein
MKSFNYLRITFLSLLLGTAAACATADEGFDDDTDFTSDEVTVVSDDDLNGLWTATIDGAPAADDVVIESWSAVGIRVRVGQTVHQMSRSGDTLSDATGTLDVHVNKSSVTDDSLTGTLDGHTVQLVRDVAPKPPITLAFPGDRPFRSFLQEVIVPAAQQDRESYKKFTATGVGAFVRSCELYKHGSWPRKFMKGATLSEQYTNFNKIISAVSNLKTTPRRLTKEYRFYNAVTQNLKDPSQAGLAMSQFSMYFSTGAGGALRMPITPDSMAYFITDKPSRAERIGVVAMATPTHSPLASTFGRQLLDLGAMPAADSPVYARTMMELLAKSDVHSALGLSGVGRSALTDWYAVMAIEDYRGMTFGFPSLGWGYNMSNVQFFGLVTRALARPGAVDSAGKPVLGQVIVGNELRPGDPSYADVLNNGNDMQEYGDMARLKTLATDYLRENHPELVTAVQDAFVGIVPQSSLDFRARTDIFHFICAQLYDTQGRTANLRGAQADRAIAAVTALFATLTAESAGFETYVLAHGITKSNVAAPKATGF